MAQQQEAVGQEVPEPAAAGPAQITREARALIGWMTEEMALRFLNGLRGDAEPTDEQRARAAAARATVAGREPTPTQDDADIVAPAPQEVLATVGAERVTALAAEGFAVRMVDLERVRGFQPNVLAEQAVERVGDVEADDPVALTRLTLPEAQPLTASFQFDESQKAWTFLYPDLNTRILGPVQVPITDQTGKNHPVLGFALGALPSLVKVGEYQGRYVLTDGYHRSFGLLNRGISRVPAIFRHVENFEDLGVPHGMLPQAQWLGTRPPRLDDYLVDEVAETVNVPAAQRLIVVQALESTLNG